MEFVYASELKKQYICYGHFYELLLGDGERAKCRSVLEIVDQSILHLDPSELSEMAPDAVVIMMNPGSSRPKKEGNAIKQPHYFRSSATMRKPLVLTQPDNTQYQIMRIGRALHWKHIRILNLSDLRDPKSGNFIKKAEALSKIQGGHTHSIFCDERIDELTHSLKRKNSTPILLGWGQNTSLLPLAEQCMSRIANERTASVQSDVHPLLTAHPSPMLQAKKVLWLRDMLAQLDSADT